MPHKGKEMVASSGVAGVLRVTKGPREQRTCRFLGPWETLESQQQKKEKKKSRKKRERKKKKLEKKKKGTKRKENKEKKKNTIGNTRYVRGWKSSGDRGETCAFP